MAKGGKAAKKTTKTIGRGTPVEVDLSVTLYTGAVIIDSVDHCREVLEMLVDNEEKLAQVIDFNRRARTAVTEYARTHDTNVIQMEGHYWRLIQSFSRFFVATPDDMPEPKPKGAKSLKEICKDKTAAGKPLWNFITKRVPDMDKLETAVKKGYLTEKEVAKAYIEKPKAVYIQKFDGIAVDGEDGD